MRGLAGGVILVLLGVYFVDNYLHARHARGVLVPFEPYQGPVGNGVAWKESGNEFTPLADFHLKARILGTESYWLDNGSVISPLDLAVGWGPMSDQAVLDELSIHQGQRWYAWRPEHQSLPLPNEEIVSHRPTFTPIRQRRRSRSNFVVSAKETSSNWLAPLWRFASPTAVSGRAR